MNTNTTTRTDLLKVDPRIINILEGHNARQNFAIDELKPLIENHGVLVPVHCYREKINPENNPNNYLCDDKGYTYFLIDGERRIKACKELIEEGVDIGRVPVQLEGKMSNEITRISEMLLRNTGKPLEDIELADGYNKLIKHGYEPKDIAEKLGVKLTHINFVLSLLILPSEVQKEIRNGNITPTAALELKRTVKNSNAMIEAIEMAKTSHDGKITSKKLEVVNEAKNKKAILKGLELILDNDEDELNPFYQDLEMFYEALKEGNNVKEALQILIKIDVLR